MNIIRLLFILALWLPAHLSAGEGQSMVVAAQRSAAEAGIEMLKKGGNAFDAAAATALALGVVEPGSSGIGGGGFFLLYIAKEDRYVMLDARETSPQLAGNGEVYKTRSTIDGPQAAGVPGLAAGVDHLVTRYGKLNRTTITAPAIDLAEKGFEVGPRLQRMLNWRKDAFNTTAQSIFLSGKSIKQKQLARTLARFAEGGANEFYRGKIADLLVADIKRDGGLIRKADLAGYRVIERHPVMFKHRQYRLISAALPSSGGMTLAHILGQLENDNLSGLEQADQIHLIVEAMKRAYHDRNKHLGDSDFVKIPDLLNKDRLRNLRSSIRMGEATPAHDICSSEPAGTGRDTTHFSIIDREGNMVAATLSINYPFGSAYVSPSTGILLNNEMDDFATRPGIPNAFGLVQGIANGVAPGKRMLSSMSPTFIVGPERTFIVGTPGGSRIISMVLLASLGFMFDDSTPEQWINMPRYHHQCLPDVIQFEAGAFSDTVLKELKRRGHTLKEVSDYGNMHAILLERKSGKAIGISDIRGEGVVATFTKEK